MRRFRWSGLCVMLVVAVLATGMPTAAWSQAPPAGAAASEAAATNDAAGVFASLAGSIVYLPFKALVICPGMALASGATSAFSGGKSQTAEHLLRVGCTGSYRVTPDMVHGRQEFLGSGKESAVRGR